MNIKPPLVTGAFALLMLVSYTHARAPQGGPPTAQSPAAQRLPQTVTPQSYPSEQVQLGQTQFASQCGFCHGRDAAGGETGPDLTRSTLVAQDVRGDKLGPLIRTGRTDRGMPAFTLSDSDLAAMVAFIHDQKTKAETLGGGRRGVDVDDLQTGNAEAGRQYFTTTGGCAKCHSPSGDLAGLAKRYQGLALLQRMLYPSGRPAPAPAKATVTLPNGQTVEGRLAYLDEFTIALVDASGWYRSWDRSRVKSKIDDPLSAHFDLLGKYSDDDMHNIFAYLQTLQ